MSDIHKTIEAVWKIESTRLIAGIARVTRDIGIAEELAQDALVAALERWPDEGIPEKPAAWLMTAAKRRSAPWPDAGTKAWRACARAGISAAAAG
jgi:RNA polymerase sigma-70 factor (ECF subfamily)